jgi:uncharacterized protein Usg
MTHRTRQVTEMQLRGYRLTTAEILYRLPDHPSLLQTFVWQDYDIAPRFPVLARFLEFWEQNLDGPLHSVRIASTELMGPRAWRRAGGVLTIQ